MVGWLSTFPLQSFPPSPPEGEGWDGGAACDREHSTPTPLPLTGGGEPSALFAALNYASFFFITTSR
jgi:hypothetical protein